MSEFSEPAYVRLFGMDAWLQENNGIYPSLLPNLPYPLGMMEDPKDLYWHDLCTVAEETDSFGDPVTKKMITDAYYIYSNHLSGGRLALRSTHARSAPQDWLQAEAKKILLHSSDIMNED